MVQKLTFNYLATAQVGIHAFSIANCTHPQLETSVALCCVTKLHILEWFYIVPSTRCTCVIIMMFNQILYMPHLSGGQIILAKEKCSLKHLFTKFERNKLFVCIEHFWDLLFQLMKHRINTLHVAFIFCSVHNFKYTLQVKSF